MTPHEQQSSRPAASDSVFASLLGDAWATLPAAVRGFHASTDTHYSGTALVRGVDHLPARLLRRVFGFPRPGASVPVCIHVRRENDGERWSRRFGERAFASSFRRDASGTLLAERFGPFRFHFSLAVADGRMHWHFRRWSLGPLPLPRALGPRIESWEAEDATGAFRFYSHADFPLLGRLIHYDGTVVPVPVPVPA
jgi:hypothetical protein